MPYRGHRRRIGSLRCVAGREAGAASPCTRWPVRKRSPPHRHCRDFSRIREIRLTGTAPTSKRRVEARGSLVGRATQTRVPWESHAGPSHVARSTRSISLPSDHALREDVTRVMRRVTISPRAPLFRLVAANCASHWGGHSSISISHSRGRLCQLRHRFSRSTIWQGWGRLSKLPDES